MKPPRIVGVLAALGLLLPAAAGAEWPYLTEEASTVGLGHFSLSAGVSRTEQDSPFLPGGRGVFWTLPEFQGTLGVGPHAEVSFDYALLYFDPSGGGATVYQSGDLRLWTKLDVLPAKGHDLSIRFGVKLPNAPDDHGLGTDNTDFFAALLLDVHLGSALLSLNAGLGILGSTETNQAQDDVFTWGAALRGPIGASFSAGFDASGYAGPWGIRIKHEYAWLGPVLTWRNGGFRIDLAGRRGIVDALGWGWVLGASYER